MCTGMFLRNYIEFGDKQAQNHVFLIASPIDLVDVVCLRGYWTLEITRLGLARGGGVRAK